MDGWTGNEEAQARASADDGCSALVGKRKPEQQGVAKWHNQRY
jgi:hypothetical protein